MRPKRPRPAQNAGPRPEAARLAAVLRALLKSRSLRYRDIAGAWNCSLATVKRVMSEDAIDLERILQLCDLLEINFYELVELCRDEPTEVVRFTPAQEEYFAVHPEYLAYFMALRSKGKGGPGQASKGGGDVGPTEIAKLHGLTLRSTRAYLRQLEQLGLLERLSGDRVRLKSRGSHIVWDDRGPIGKLYSRQFVDGMAARAAASLDQPAELKMEIGSKTLTDAEYADFQRDLETLVVKYRRASQFNLAAGRGARAVSYLLVLDRWADPFFDRIPEI